ncbi:5532_t:CDS:2 [Acaulospora morrowiae]|uniref:5532_t:CDS:1 n=1 Tax=Acaulospora morrowiae TaxID=94023 RepID=A0A9N9DZ42_9GLOM|nr:5532_t:CDS:2 [Acaulospora morrowiae]
MANTVRRIYWTLVFVVSLIPLLGAFYGSRNESPYIHWLGCIGFISVLTLGLCFFVSFHLCRCCAPFVIGILSGTSRSLSPIVKYLNKTRFLGPLLSWCIRSIFFFWFIVLIVSDVLIRKILSRTAGVHESTGCHFSPIGASNKNFQPLGLFDDLEDVEETNKSKVHEIYHGNYNQKVSLSLAMASKLAYEDVPIIRHELEKSGYDMKTFKPIAYKNICGYIVEKKLEKYDVIIVVFRGSNPLNVQNFLTDIRSLLVPIKSPTRGCMGLVHEGFYEALGEHVDDSIRGSGSQAIIELYNTSLVKTLETTISALKTLLYFVFKSVIAHIQDPIDHRYLGEEERHFSAYAQASNWIMKLCNGCNENNTDNYLFKDNIREQRVFKTTKKKLFVTGHSLGGGLATAKLLQHDNSLSNILSGVYTYGQPNVGDIQFAESFGPELSKKMFHHTYNNDCVPRIPPWKPYCSPPGNLVYIDSSYSIYIYPPDPITSMPVLIRGISFVHLSGLLNLNVIRRMMNESWLRILFRIVFPFFVNDHFPGDYAVALRDGTVERVIREMNGIGGIEES